MQRALQQGVNMHVATAAALFNVKRFPGLDQALKAPLRDMPNTPCWGVVSQVCRFKVF
jgi:hypothetical protein